MSTRPAIGVVGLAEDDETRSVSGSLTERGAEVQLIDFRNFPLNKTGGLERQRWRYQSLDLGKLDACYLRVSGYNWPYPGQRHPAGAWSSRYLEYQSFLQNEVASLSFKECLLRDLGARIPFVNPQPLQELHRLKVYQLHLLRKHGIPVAESLASNNSAELSRFAQKTGECVCKPLAGVLKTGRWDDATEAAVKRSGKPVVLQRYMPGRTVRCYVVDDKLVASAEILHGGEIDSSIGQRGVRITELPARVVDSVLAAARALGLLFSGIDVQHDTQRDEYAILECNISPMFANFSRMTGIDVPGALADLLIRLATRNREASAELESVKGMDDA